MIARVFSIAGGLLFATSITWFIWFYLFGLERRGAGGFAPGALTFDVALFSIFAIHHSVFARTPVRAWVARTVSPRIERSIYVWVSSIGFLAVCLLWKPAGPVMWDADGGMRIALRALQVSGVIFTLWAAQALDSLALAGIRQVDAPLPRSGVETGIVTLQDTGPYGVVRHPIYLGWLLIVWPAPAMTGGHLVFAAISTLYLVIATIYEERTLRATFGPAYGEYAKRVRWKMLPGVH